MRYEVISSRWSSHFWVKMHVFFFPFLSTIKVKLVGETTRSNYFFFILHVYNINSHCFYSPPRAAPPPIKYTSSWREDQMLSTEGKKSFRNSATYQKSKREGGGGVSSTPSPTLYHDGGMTLCVRPRVNFCFADDFEWSSCWRLRLPSGITERTHLTRLTAT